MCGVGPRRWGPRSCVSEWRPMSFHTPELQLADAGWLFAAPFALILIVPVHAERTRTPVVIGFVLAGMLAGPDVSGLGLLEGGVSDRSERSLAEPPTGHVIAEHRFGPPPGSEPLERASAMRRTAELLALVALACIVATEWAARRSGRALSEIDRGRGTAGHPCGPPPWARTV